MIKMPWEIKDVDRFKKGLSDKKKRQWVRIANTVLDKCMKDGGEENECAGSAIKQANKIVGNMETMMIHATTTTLYKIQTGSLEGRKYMIVPVVMMVEGVHSGSHGPLLHLAEELNKFPACWNGIPVMIYHPQIDGMNVSANSPEILEQSVGKIFNTHIEDGKLKAEAWIDEQKLIAISPITVDYIREGKPLDVSVGVFSDEELGEGVYINEHGEEEQYIATARNYRPDHLALLPGQRGACSWMDGCGVRVNSDSNTDGVEVVISNINENENMKKDELVLTMKQQAMEALLSDITDNKQGYQELMMQLQSKLDAMDTEESYHILEEVYEDTVVYRKRSRESVENGLFQQSYQINEDGTVSLIDTPIRVRRNVTYVQINSMKRTVFNSNKGETKMVEESKPCCLEKVVELIGNEQTQFTPNDKDWLLTMSAEQLEKLTPVAPKAEETIVDPPVQVNMEEYIRKDTLTTFEAFLEIAPDGIKEVMQKGAELYAQHRTELISNIMANAEQGAWTEDELKGFDTTMLEKLNRQFKPTVDYSGQAAGNAALNTQSNEQGPKEKLLPLGV